MNTDSYVKDCYIELRRGETIFNIKDNGDFVARLKGYAIIPKDKYEKLVSDYFSKKASSFDQV